jgi:hypothetical protein
LLTQLTSGALDRATQSLAYDCPACPTSRGLAADARENRTMGTAAQLSFGFFIADATLQRPAPFAAM